MEKYVKGEEMEIQLDPPFSDCLVQGVPRLRVKANVRVQNLVSYAEKLFYDTEKSCCSLLFIGVGPACAKTVTCVEVLKRRFEGPLYQNTKACFKRIEEYWEPSEEHLDRLKVNRDIPIIFILISKEKLDESEPGYQSRGENGAFFSEAGPSSSKNDVSHRMLKKSGIDQSNSDGHVNLWKRKSTKSPYGQNNEKGHKNTKTKGKNKGQSSSTNIGKRTIEEGGET